MKTTLAIAAAGTIRSGFRDAIPLAIAVGAFGISFGVLARAAGMGPVAPLVMSLTTFGGSAQFAATGVEDTGIPKAIRGLRLPSVEHIVYPGPGGPLPKGASDPEWIALAGGNRYLAFSQNRLILASDAEREAVVQAAAGIIFLGTGQERSWLVMRLLLNQWSWVLETQQEVPRPFAFHLSMAGRKSRLL